MTAADAGRIFLLLAFSFTAFQLIATIWGATRGLPELIRSARNAAVATAVAMVGAMLALLYALLSRDFSLRYVAETTSRAMPLDCGRPQPLWGPAGLPPDLGDGVSGAVRGGHLAHDHPLP